jgi:hypothetical protein
MVLFYIDDYSDTIQRLNRQHFYNTDIPTA